MKPFACLTLSFGLVGLLATSSHRARAQNGPIPITKKVVGGKILKIDKRPVLTRPIGERYRLQIRAVIQHVTNIEDGDGRYECYGYLRLNKVPRWTLPSSEAQNFRRGAGEQLDISADTAHIKGGPFNFSVLYGVKNPEVDLQFALTDYNQSGPRRVAVYLDSLDLRKISQDQTEYRCRNGGGEVLLFVKVERVGFIFAPRLIPTPRPKPTPSTLPKFLDCP